MENKKYASIHWTIEDVKEFRPNWTDAQCHAFLKLEEQFLRDFLIEQGNEYLQGMINNLNESED